MARSHKPWSLGLYSVPIANVGSSGLDGRFQWALDPLPINEGHHSSGIQKHTVTWCNGAEMRCPFNVVGDPEVPGGDLSQE